MITLRHIPDKTMDTIMSVARKTSTQPRDVIKVMLETVDEDDAMRAIYEWKNRQKKQ